MKRNDGMRIAAMTVLGGGALLAATLATRGGADAPVRPAAPATARAVPAPVSKRPVPTPTPAPTLEIKSILPVTGPIEFGDWEWDETGAPAGRVVMTVDLKAQTISVFRAGHEIGTAAVLYGANDKPTPLGRFPIMEKDADHVSNLYGAPMPYMLRLTGDGVAIHGSKVEWGLATHGCIGVPVAFAKKLFDATERGDLVIVTRGKLLKLGDRIA
jgi:lipoprotein-anchoring transpeptidase ErfK/SrfK